jgi:spore coat protein CotH
MGSTYSGIVLDSKTNSPVMGVRVSIGFTDTVVYTDRNGNFSFGSSGIVKSSPSIVSEPFFVTKTAQGAVIDLRNCRSVTAVRLFDLNGRCFYRKIVSSMDRTVHLPEVTIGMHIIQLLSDNGVSYATKWNAINELQSASISSHSNQGNKRGAGPVGNSKIMFRHDDYYPLEIEDGISPATIKMKSDPRGELFDQKKIGRYDFNLTRADSISMEKNALLEEYVPADFSYNNVLCGKVGLRYKGSTYSLPNCFEDDGTRKDKPECRKISFKIKFDNYIDTLRFYKQKKLNLHSESIDATKMHDILSYELFREMGITAPRCAFAEVYLNNIFQGVFCAVEDVDGRFTDARWPGDGDGNVYKEKWPISGSLAYYRGGLVTNDKPEDSTDVSRMVAFYQAVKNADAATFADLVSPFFDFDYWLHYIAADRVIHNADGVMTWYAQPDWFSNHNYYLYQPEVAAGKLWIIPWDLHVTFGRKDPIVDAMGVPDWNVAPESCEPDSILWGYQLGVPAHCDKLIGLTADVFWDNFVKISEKMLKTCFDVSYLQGKVDFYKNLIDTLIQRDPYVDHTSWAGQVNSLKKDVAALNSDFDDYIHKRIAVEDTSGYTAPFDGKGYLVTDRVNNFEFTPLGNEKNWSYHYVSENSSITVRHDTINPIWGKGDVLYSFVFNPAPGEGQYIEWGRIFMKFEKVTDLSGLKEIRVNLRSDSNRDLWVFIQSNAYTKNDVTTEYGWWEASTSKGAQHVFSISSIGYPSWATGNLPDILSDVLSSASAIGFSSNPHFNAGGKLASVPDSGCLLIDNIRLIF